MLYFSCINKSVFFLSLTGSGSIEIPVLCVLIAGDAAMLEVITQYYFNYFNILYIYIYIYIYMKSSFPKRYKSVLIAFMKIKFFYLDPYILLIFNLSC